MRQTPALGVTLRCEGTAVGKVQAARGLWRTIFWFDKLKVLTVGDGEAAEMEADTMTLHSTSSEEKYPVPEPRSSRIL
jgi:hypothetical protein